MSEATQPTLRRIPESEPSLNWKKAEILAKIIGALILPLFIVLATFAFDSAIKERELRAKNFEIATNILRGDKDKIDENVWTWAVNTFSELATVSPDENTINAVNNTGLYSQPVAEFISQQLRAWLSENPKNHVTLKTWLEENNVGVGSTLFLIQDEYASRREQFLKEQGIWGQ